MSDFPCQCKVPGWQPCKRQADEEDGLCSVCRVECAKYMEQIKAQTLATPK